MEDLRSVQGSELRRAGSVAVRTPHSSTNRGKRVWIILRSGERFIAKFEARTAKFVVLDGGRKVRMRDIRSFSLRASQSEGR